MIIANIATIPEREQLLEKTVNSLKNQVDIIFICLNGHAKIPNFLIGSKNIIIQLSDNKKGDAGKFWLYCTANLQIADWFFCDDDII